MLKVRQDNEETDADSDAATEESPVTPFLQLLCRSQSVMRRVVMSVRKIRSSKVKARNRLTADGAYNVMFFCGCA